MRSWRLESSCASASRARQTLPLDRVVAERDHLSYVVARHETAIPHIAWGYYEAGGEPAAIITVPGAGETNAMHGL